MRVIYMAKNKESSVNALKFLIRKNIEIVYAIIPKGNNKLYKICKKNNINIASDNEIYRIIENNKNEIGNIDIVISFLFWRIIKKPLIDIGEIGCINFHPAPLPEYRGVATYSFGILDEVNEWGVSCHYVNEEIDKGDIVKVKRFEIDSNITVQELEDISQKKLLNLFKKVINKIDNGKKLEKYAQDENKGKYISKELMEKSKKIDNTDKKEEIDKKIRAFWFPPYHGAYIILDGEKYTLVNKTILNKISKKKNELT